MESLNLPVARLEIPSTRSCRDVDSFTGILSPDSAISSRLLLVSTARPDASPLSRRDAPLLLNCHGSPADLELNFTSDDSHESYATVWESACNIGSTSAASSPKRPGRKQRDGNLSDSAEEGMTRLQAAAALVTTVLGCGVLALPSLMRLGGWFLVPALGVITSLAFMEVARVMDGALATAEEQLGCRGIQSFEDFGRAALGSLGVSLVRCITTLGFCGTLVVYTILIGQNTHAMLGRALPKRWVMVLTMPLLLSLGLARDMKALSKFMPIGVFASVTSCVLICVKASLDAQIWQAWPTEGIPEVHSAWPSEPESLGTIVAVLFSAYSVMGTVPFIRANMRCPIEFLPTFRASMSLVSATYMIVMLVGYWGYGNFVQDNVVQSMMFAPEEPSEAFKTDGHETSRRRPNAVGALMAILVTTYLSLGFGLFFSCVVGTFQRLGDGKAAWCIPGTLMNGILRASLVLVCVLVGSAVPHFREVMSIMASLCCSCNNVFFPLLFAHKLQRSTASFRCRVCHAGIIILAIFCAIVGVHDSTSKLVSKMGS